MHWLETGTAPLTLARGPTLIIWDYFPAGNQSIQPMVEARKKAAKGRDRMPSI
jgi:hypothetical protein